MGNDKEYVFSLKGEKKPSGETSANPKNLKNIVLNYVKGDVGNMLHEIKHGYQVMDGSLTVNSDGSFQPTATATYGTPLAIAGTAIEAQAYQRQLSYTGEFTLWVSPEPGSKAYKLNQIGGLLGTSGQINDTYKASRYSDFFPAFIPRIMKESISNTRLYPEY